MPFAKGQSGNPAGRKPVPKAFKQACVDLTEKGLAALEKAMGQPGERVQAIALVFAYAYGKPVARIDHRVIRSVADLGEEELLAILASGEDGDSGQELVH